jgi:heptosyltransferase-1
MGDVIHTLPAAASLRASFPASRISWLVDQRWRPLLDGSPVVDEVVAMDKSTLRGHLEARRALRTARYDVVIDFQGLIRSAWMAAATRAPRIVGYHRAEVREWPAVLFYHQQVRCTAAHIVDRHLELARAVGAQRTVHEFSLPPGQPEGELPPGPFVLACPLAGWTSKQWPTEHWRDLARALAERGLVLVLNGPATAEPALRGVEGAWCHLSGLAGLIDVTRRAVAVVGIDSGPLHLAAALGRPGVAVFGPTDPGRNGPYGGTITILRHPSAITSYRRASAIDPSMRAITAAEVMAALAERAGLPR